MPDDFPSTTTTELPGLAPEATGRQPDGAASVADVAPAATVAVAGVSLDGAGPTTARPPDSGPAVTAARPDRAAELARLVAEGRQPRSRHDSALEPFRDVLLTERRSGASIRLLVQSLAKLGVAVSAETLRVWFLQHKLPKRRRSGKPSAKAMPARPLAPTSTASAAAPPTPFWQRKGPRIARDQY